MRLVIDKDTFIMAHFHRERMTSGAPDWIFCNIHAGPCTTKKGPCITPSVMGVARCSERDRFCKATGRKIAFTRAISSQPRDVRAKLWAAYHMSAKNTMKYLDTTPTSTTGPMMRGLEANHVGIVRGGDAPSAS